MSWLLGSWTSGTDLGGAVCVRRAFRAFACRVGAPKSAWAEKEGARGGGSLSFYLRCRLSRPLSLSHTVAVLCVCKKHSCHRNEDSVGNTVLGTDDYRCRRTQLEKPPGGRDICMGVLKASLMSNGTSGHTTTGGHRHLLQLHPGRRDEHKPLRIL